MTTLPVINMNGDVPKTLAMQAHEVLKALDKLRVAMNEMSPHGRNYIGNDQWWAARAEHIERYEALEKVKHEVTLIFEHCIGAM